MNYSIFVVTGELHPYNPQYPTHTLQTGVDVAVNFLSLVIFVFLLFVVMVMYANEVETKEKYKLPEIKNELQYLHFLHLISFHNHFFYFVLVLL